jgi:hypothetical protein
VDKRETYVEELVVTGIVGKLSTSYGTRRFLSSVICVIYLLTAIGLTPGGSSTVYVYTQIIRRTTQSTQTMHRATQLTNSEECGPCPVFASYTLAFALQMRKKKGKTSVRVETSVSHHLQELVTGVFHEPEQSNPHVLLVQVKDIRK